jgi:hypothetical protein
MTTATDKAECEFPVGSDHAGKCRLQIFSVLSRKSADVLQENLQQAQRKTKEFTITRLL